MAKVGNKKKDYKPNNELYTPKWLFEKLNIDFDLDPAHPEYPTNVPCKKYFTQKDDGLKQNWEGLVWLNPPFSQPKPFIEKFIQHANGIALVGMSRSKAFKDLWEKADGILLLPSQIAFDNPQGQSQKIFMPCVVVAMGEKAIQVLNNSGIGRVR